VAEGVLATLLRGLGGALRLPRGRCSHRPIPEQASAVQRSWAAAAGAARKCVESRAVMFASLLIRLVGTILPEFEWEQLGWCRFSKVYPMHGVMMDRAATTLRLKRFSKVNRCLKI